MAITKAPAFGEPSFSCPHCGALAEQVWHDSVVAEDSEGGELETTLAIAVCHACGGYSIWNDKKMIYPHAVLAPQPNADLPTDVIDIYREAGMIVNASPRGAAALLRLAVESLCDYLGAEGKDLNDRIGWLVRKGMPAQTQQALDYARVIGNHAVHPGMIAVGDDPRMVAALFSCINLIAESLLTQPRATQELYDSLPESYRQQVERRDRGS